MKQLLTLISLFLIMLASCKKDQTLTSPSLFLLKLQGTWVRTCGCTPDFYKFSNDTIYASYSAANGFHYSGYVKKDTAYFECIYCTGTPINLYLPFPLSFSSDSQKLYMGSGNDYICRDSTCTNVSYHKVN